MVGAVLHVATHLRLLARASCLYLDGVRRATSPFTAIDPYSRLMLVVLGDFSVVLSLEASRDSEPKESLGLEPSCGATAALFLVL